MNQYLGRRKKVRNADRAYLELSAKPMKERILPVTFLHF